MRRRGTTTAALLLLLGGCVHYHAQPVDPVARAQAFSSRRLDDPALRAFVETSAVVPPAAWPPASWDLDTLTLAAFYFQPDLDVAEIERAGGDAIAAAVVPGSAS